MDATLHRKRRLEQLLELAQTYRGWNRRALAKALGRVPGKLVPASGVPKLDLVVELAEVLDWPVGDVVASLCQREGTSESTAEATDFMSLDDAARRAHRSGEYRLMIDLARHAYTVATAPDQRALACNREAGGWDGLGQYTQSLQAVARGLQEAGVAPELRRMLQSNLANAYYTLWSLVESQSISQSLLDHYQEQAPQTTRDRKTHAFAQYVCGHTFRRLISLEPERSRELAESANQHLELACRMYRDLSAELGDASLEGIANTCHGGMIEAMVELEQRSPTEALRELSDGVERLGEGPDAVMGDRLESYGWWCIFGCNITLRHSSDERELQHYMAVFTNMAEEVAERLDNWSIRERVFTMQYTSWQRALSSSGFDIPLAIDTDDIRAITGTMGRFPTFRGIGWQILQRAQIVQSQ